MTEQEKIQKTIRHLETVRDGAVAVLESGFGTNPGESDLVYRNRKMYAETAISALEKQTPKKPDLVNMTTVCPDCGEPVKRCYSYCHDCGQHIDWEN